MTKTFLDYWGHYGRLEQRHLDWVGRHAMPLPDIPKDWPLFAGYAREDYLYYVTEGLLTAVSWDPQAHRRIHLLCPTGHNLMTARNFHTDKRVDYQIVALRDSAALRLPVNALKAFGETDRMAATLMSVLREKHNKQYVLHNALLQIRPDGARYDAFVKYLQHWFPQLTHEEVADYLCMSVSSVNRGRRGDL